MIVSWAGEIARGLDDCSTPNMVVVPTLCQRLDITMRRSMGGPPLRLERGCLPCARG